MKLSQHLIYESNVSAAQEGKRIVDLIMKKFFEKLKSRSFVYGSTWDIVKDLNQISPKKIKFQLSTHKASLGRFLSYALYDFDYQKIIIEINPKTSDYLRRFAKEKSQKFFFDPKKNQFYKEMFEILTHELVHKAQHMKAGSLEAFGEEVTDDDTGYFSRKVEIDSFALQAALQVIHGDRSTIWDLYTQHKSDGIITDKTYKKFMKKVYSNIKELQKLGMTK
jgi:hypothetical protein